MMKTLSRPRRRPDHFAAAYTLFEIMLVLGIIAVLVGSAIYLLVGNLDVAKEARVEADIQSISTQLRVYEMQNLRPPTTEQGLQALVKRPGGDPPPRRWRQLLAEIPLDPWGIPYKYYWPGKKNPQGFDLFSCGADRQEGTADDIGNSRGE